MTDSRIVTSGGACPYSVAVSDDDDEHHGNFGNVMQTARKSCPAFANDSSSKCPFQNAKTSSDVQKTLLQVPPSHLKASGPFQQALQHIHQVASSSFATKQEEAPFQLEGGCPMQTYHAALKSDGNNASGSIPFVQAMEEWSLASVMAQMASDLEQELSQELHAEDNQEAHEEEKQPSVVSSPTMSLAFALRTGTAASHEAAENVHFVKNFIHGKIDRTLYGELVLALYHVYDALESHLDQHAPKHFLRLHFPVELNRKDSLLQDVDFWHGHDVLSKKEPSPATRDYVERIDWIAETNPLLLLSHAYTRYLGDLSGGKILARVARKALFGSRHATSDGLAFYEFDKIDSYKRFKDKYRQALDELRLTPQQVEGLVQEANVAFLLNMRIFEELDVMANIPGARIRSMESVLELAQGSATNKSSDKDDKCPFAKTNEKSATSGNAAARCPWPFVFLHDFAMGLRDWQTWFVLGLILCWLWSNQLGASQISN